MFAAASSSICSTTSSFTYQDFLQPALIFLLSSQADLSFFLLSLQFAFATFFSTCLLFTENDTEDCQ